MIRRLAILCVIFGPWNVGVGQEPSAPPTEVEVKLVFTPGETFRHRIVTQSVGSIQMKLLPDQKFSQTFEQEVAYKCTKVNPDKSGVFEIWMPRIAMDMSLGGMKMAWSSDDAQNDEAGSGDKSLDAIPRAIFKAFTGIHYTLVMDADGKPRKLEGLSEGFKRVLAQFEGQEMPAGVKEFFAKLGDWMTDDVVTSHMEAGQRMIPPKKVARVGDTWEHSWDQPLPFVDRQMKGHGKFELVAFETFRGRMCAKIRTSETLSTAESKTPDGKAGRRKGILDRMQFDIAMKSGDGDAYLDVRTWDLVQWRQVQDMTIKISMPPDPEAQDDELKEGIPTIVQNLKTSVRLELIEDDTRATRVAP